MFLKRERPETNQFAIEKISGCEGNILSRNFNISRKTKCQETPLQKYSENVFAYYCVSEHSELFLFFPYKNLHFLTSLPSAKNVSSFLVGFPQWLFFFSFISTLMKKVVFCLEVQRVLTPPLFMIRPLKNLLFVCVSSLNVSFIVSAS